MNNIQKELSHGNARPLSWNILKTYQLVGSFLIAVNQ